MVVRARSLNPVDGLRIAHLIESDGPGGAETVVVQLATALQRHGAENVVFLPLQGEGWLADRLAGTGVRVDHFHLERPFSPLCARSLAAAFRRHGVTIAHSHEFSMAFYGAWASRRARVPHVITMHGGRYYAHRLRRRLALRAAVAASARIVAVSASLKRDISRDLWLTPSRILTIPNGVPYVRPERVTLRNELRLGPDDRLIVSVGNLYPVKGHEYLIDALGLLASRYPTLYLAIAGRGALAGALTSRAQEHGLAKRVHLLGLRPDVPGVLAAGDLFVLPSLSEGLPLALLEAMFAGLPIVASDVGEMPAALDHGRAGMLVEAASAGALAVAIDHLLHNPGCARTLAERAARRAAAEYDVSQMVRRYVALYTGSIEGRSQVLDSFNTLTIPASASQRIADPGYPSASSGFQARSRCS